MKKVLVIAPYAYLPWHSGGQKFIARFLHHLGKETNLTVVSVAENDIALADTYKVIPLLKKSFARYYDFSLVKKISVLVQQEKFDAIIWEHPYYAWLALQVRKRTGVKIFIHTHNIEYQRFKSTGRWWWPVLKWYEKWCFKKADGLFFISPEDKNFAVTKWGIPLNRCFDLPFGVDVSQSPEGRSEARQIVGRRYAIPDESRLLLFTGALNYKPNLDALRIILERINPLLMSRQDIKYKILVCGKGLPDEMDSLKKHIAANIIYAGFVSDIETFYKAADYMLNPVLSGGGVKTKLIEAIAYGSTVISTKTGAAGVESSICGDKLIIHEDGDWQGFAGSISLLKPGAKNTPAAYYQTYFWGNIIKSVSSVL